MTRSGGDVRDHGSPDSQAVLAQTDEGRRQVPAIGELLAEGDVAGERQGEPASEGFSGGVGTREKAVTEGPHDRREGAGVAGRAQGEFDQVSEEIAGVERRVAHGREVEVDDPQTRVLDEHLVRIEIPVKQDIPIREGKAIGEAETAFQDVEDSRPERGNLFGDPGEPGTERLEFVGEGVTT